MQADGRRQPVRAGRSDGGGEYDDDDVQTGHNDVRNETDCDGAVVVALLGFKRSHMCACMCVRARYVVVMVVGTRARTCVHPPPPPPNGIR